MSTGCLTYFVRHEHAHRHHPSIYQGVLHSAQPVRGSDRPGPGGPQDHAGKRADAGIPGGKGGQDDDNSPLAIWHNWADSVSGAAIDAGHFVCEENPQATLAALLPFLRQGQ